MSVLNYMESLRRNFFNGIQEGDRKIASVKWSKVLASKKFGGLGVSSFFALNRALLFKCVWRYLSHDNSLWFRIISALHGLNGHVLSAAFNSTWSSIITEVNSLKVKGVDLISHCKIRVGKGTGTSFWKDLWIGDNLLKLSFPRLFALEENKDISVADKMNTSISSSFRRHVQEDVRSMLDEAFLPKMEVPTRWIKSIPIKVNVFAWKLYLDRLPTRSNLSRRNVSLPSLACPLCDHVLEDSSHLFFGCSVAKDIQKLICRWWNLDVHPYESYEDWLSWFKSIRLGSKTKEVLEGVFYVSWWSLWNFRNQFLFASPIPRKDAIFDNIVLRSFYCDTMATEPNDVRLSILGRLREELEAEVALTNNLLDVLTRYLDQMRSRGPEMMRVESPPDHPLINYCLHTLQRTTGVDMINGNNLVAARNALLRSIVEKEKFINNYRVM
ncbi:RNA-directed DNA polymerase, eukaryota [Tanacetum coccineum]